ncbi:MAG: hypothetical protein Q9186_001070 [Xanthomendoza sp. 1 TL-2023]
MTPRNPRTHQRTLSAQIQPSDQYDSDIPFPPPFDTIPPQRTNAELNLSVLQRHLPSTTSIVSIAPYAVVYVFTSTPQNGAAWEKSGIEGTLFVCRQKPESGNGGGERYSVVVLNRKGLNDFICPLSGDIDFEAGYIILRSTKNNEESIWGLWIFEEDEGSSTAGMREVNAKIIRDCATKAGRNHVNDARDGAVDGYGSRI